MIAMQLARPQPIDQQPLAPVERPMPEPGEGEVRIRVRACGVCHTDLHIVEGDIPHPKLPIVPGHQIVGVVDARGPAAARFREGDRAGVPWLYSTCGACEYCLTGRENLCENARFTGYHVDGGYAEYMIVPEAFAYRLPDGFDDLQAAPLLCAGVIGYRALRLSEVKPGQRLGLYGFGASAHIAIQVARHWGCEVYVFTRSEAHRRHARQLGAAWAGRAEDSPPAAGVLVSNRVTLSDSAVMIAVADTVEGDVRVQVKPQVAAVFGAAFGTALAVTLLLGRRSR